MVRQPTSRKTATADPGTAQRILEAAAEIFARQGFRHATVRDICAQARVNVAAVNYHFGDKASLYQAVLENEFAQALTRYPMLLGVAPDAPAPAQLQAFIRSFLLRLLADGETARLPRLMAWEMVDPTAALDVIAQRVARPMAQRLRGIVRELVGPAVAEEDLIRAALSVVGQIFFQRLGQPMTRRVTAELPQGPDAIDAMAEHIYRFSLAGLAALPGARMGAAVITTQSAAGRPSRRRATPRRGGA